MVPSLQHLQKEIAERLSPYLLEPPINLASVAKEFGVKVVRAQLPSGVSGEIRPDPETPGSFVIRVNRNDTARRQRFTVAHELGHFFLHRDAIGNGISDDVLYRSSLSDSREVQANRFAADILMPQNLVNQWLRNAESLKVDDKVEFLADKFNVSEAAMRVRLGLA